MMAIVHSGAALQLVKQTTDAIMKLPFEQTIRGCKAFHDLLEYPFALLKAETIENQ